MILQAGLIYLSFKITMDDAEWTDSRRVDCVDVFMYDIILIAGIANHSKPQWLILNGQTVGELTV